MHRVLAAAATAEGPAWIPGALVALEGYPGLIEGTEPSARVRGELWRIHDASVWETLDAYEGDEYRRISRIVTTDHGRDAKAWVYLYVGSAEGLPRIPHGDWLTVG